MSLVLELPQEYILLNHQIILISQSEFTFFGTSSEAIFYQKMDFLTYPLLIAFFLFCQQKYLSLLLKSLHLFYVLSFQVYQ